MKKQLKNLFKYLCIAICTSIYSSCNYLNVDEYFNDMIPLDTVFARQELLERYLWGASYLLPNEGDLYSNSFGPYMTATDECLMSWRKAEYAGTFLQADQVTPFSGYYNMWDRYYQGIRKANTVMTRIDECKDLATFDRREILGLAHFLRGYFYFHLLQLYGPVPLLPDEPLDVGAPLEELCYERNTYDECVDYICADMEIAYDYLEASRPSNQITRPTKYAAAAVISRVRLYAASPWYNGNTAYSTWTTSDGRHFISQERDNSKWALAAEAALRIIESDNFSLHTVMRGEGNVEFNGGGLDPEVEAEYSASFPDGMGDIDPYRSYANMFNGETPVSQNPEVIYSMTLSNTNTQIALPLSMDGYNGCNITQVLVDAYRMNDGSDYNIDEHPDYYQLMTETDKTFSGYILNPSGGTANNGNAQALKKFNNREPHFYATVAFNESYWEGTSITNSSELTARTKQVMHYYVGQNGYQGPNNPEDYCLTGYICRKYVHPEDNARGSAGGVIKAKTFPIFRYAEILLNYVEALNNLEQPYTVGDSVTIERDPAQIQKYFNMIRFRAGLPGITLAEASNPQTMQDLIERERMVEFAHEGRRYHDVRRWGIAMETENAPVRGCNVEINANSEEGRRNYYRPVNVDHQYAQHTFTQKMYFWPIPDSKLKQNPLLVQNPGW